MRVLLDECVVRRLLRDLADHDTKTVKQLGWTMVRYGALLELAASQFDVFVAVDANLPAQQNLRRLDLAVIVLHGRTTRLADLRALLPRLRTALEPVRAQTWSF